MINAIKEVRFEIEEEDKEFINEMYAFFTHCKVGLCDGSTEYNLMEDIQHFLNDLRNGKSFRV